MKEEEKEEILFDYAVEEIHDKETLSRYITKYPELTNDLIDLSSELWLGRAEENMHNVKIPTVPDNDKK